VEPYYIDLRGAPRIEVTFPVASEQKDGPFFVARNLSLSGVQLESVDYIDTLKEHTFVFHPIVQPSFKIRGVALWWKYAGNKYVYGVKFSRLGFVSRYNLRRFMKKHASFPQPVLH
jgi:hypothetical protein